VKVIKQAKERTQGSRKKIIKQTARIIGGVVKHGDRAVLRYSRKFDASLRSEWRVRKSEIEDAYSMVDAGDVKNMRRALENIRAFAEAQAKTILPLESFYPMPGLELGHKIVPLDSACCYVPGGNYPLYSSALMLIAPARIAGVGRVAACSPVMRGTGQINPKTLVAMDIAGAHEIYALGGVQAIAAFSYGTDQIVPVDLIVGPGNAFVAEAKRQCYGQVGIDFVAGPSEVLVLADGTADPYLIACDLLAQCEHDRCAQAILVSTSEELGKKVIAFVEKELQSLPSAAIAGASWRDYGGVYIAASIKEAAEFSNLMSPEHLELQCENNAEAEALLKNYGALFVGRFSAEVFGDYAAGPNHTLPTMRAARYTGGVWVGTFLKTLCRQCANAAAAEILAPLAASLAQGEGLFAHSNAAKARLTNNA
jgi:histidinol dehydrogenase